MKKLTLIILSLGLLIFIDGCGLKPAPVAPTALDTTLPVIQINGHIQDMTSIAFEWKDINSSRVTGISVYRSSPKLLNHAIVYYTSIYNRFATHYVDSHVRPNTVYKYFFTTFSKHAQSLASRTITVTTPPVPPSIVWLQGISGMPRSAKIIWRPDTNPLVEGYIIERKTIKNPKWLQIVKLKGRLNSEYIDTNLLSNLVYYYKIKVYTYNNLISTPSQTVKIITKPLPLEITNLTASINLPRKIKLSWFPSLIKDFGYYKIYRSSNPVKDFKYYAKTKNPHFIDIINKDAKTYYYKIAVVDTDGLQSKNNIAAIRGTTLPKPEIPNLATASVTNNKIQLTWQDSDPRVVSFIIIKKTKISWIDSKIQKFTNITAHVFNDPYVYANVPYIYKIIAVDKYGLQSLPSKPIKVLAPNLPLQNKASSNHTTTINGSTIKPTQNLDTNSL